MSRTITILRRLPRRNNTARYYCPSPFCFFSFSFSLPRVSFRRVRQFEPATHRSQLAFLATLRARDGYYNFYRYLSITFHCAREEWERAAPGVLLSLPEKSRTTTTATTKLIRRGEKSTHLRAEHGREEFVASRTDSIFDRVSEQFKRCLKLNGGVEEIGSTGTWDLVSRWIIRRSKVGYPGLCSFSLLN